MRAWLFALLLFALTVVPVALAARTSEPCAYYFYGSTCPHCAALKPWLDSYEANTTIAIHRFEIYGNATNRELINRYFEAYGVPVAERGVPALFTADHAYVGGPAIEAGIATAAACPRLGNATGTVPPSRVPIGVVIAAALVDSINPCAIAVLTILLTTIIIAGNRKRAIRAGIAYTIAIYLAYTLFGFAIGSALFAISGAVRYFDIAVGALAIIIGLLNLKDGIWYAGGGFVMEIPRAWRPTMVKLLQAVTSPIGAFGIGFVITLFELPCTGGPYLFILGLLAEQGTMLTAIPYLLLYNVFFVLPLLVITILVARGMGPERINAWKERNIRLLHLVAGIILVALGAYLLLR